MIREHEKSPSKSSLLTVKETEAGWVSLAVNDLKSVMPKVVWRSSLHQREVIARWNFCVWELGRTTSDGLEGKQE